MHILSSLHGKGIDMTNLSQPQAEATHELERLTEELRDNLKIESIRIEESLKYLITCTFHENYDQIKNAIATQILTGEIHKSQGRFQWGTGESSSRISPERKNTLIALTYLLLSEAENRQNSIASASKLICLASYFEGYASGLVEPRINEGARGRSKSSQENQNKIADGYLMRKRDARD